MYDSRDASGEPTLDDLLAEPVVRLMMARDHVNAEQIRGIVDSARLWAFAPQRGRDRSGRGRIPPRPPGRRLSRRIVATP